MLGGEKVNSRRMWRMRTFLIVGVFLQLSCVNRRVPQLPLFAIVSCCILKQLKQIRFRSFSGASLLVLALLLLTCKNKVDASCSDCSLQFLLACSYSCCIDFLSWDTHWSGCIVTGFVVLFCKKWGWSVRCLVTLPCNCGLFRMCRVVFSWLFFILFEVSWCVQQGRRKCCNSVFGC